jgi:hypothetical protein
MTLCPCISSGNERAICNHREAIGATPSLFERENYCFSLYELCPVFCGGNVKGFTENEPININNENPAYV